MPDPDLSPVDDIGRVMRALRRAQGVTQVDLADLAGVGPRFVSEIENGKKTAEIGKVVQVLAALGATLVVVPRGAGPGRNGEPR
jgi:HTH-type transcriptional regulator / antitoxin HipB